jgi:flagellar FliL protein
MSDEKSAPPAAEAAPKKKSRKGLIIAIASLLVLGGGGAGAYYSFAGKQDEPAAGDKSAKKDAEKVDKKAAEPKLPALYVKYEPPFVVNFDAKGVMRFLQVSMEAMTRDAHTEELIKSNEPKIRNNMLLLLGSQTYDTISTMEGKEELRKKALEIIAKVVDEEGGESKKVEDIYFTSFVMQ